MVMWILTFFLEELKIVLCFFLSFSNGLNALNHQPLLKRQMVGVVLD
jgi:hypothetical protein